MHVEDGKTFHEIAKRVGHARDVVRYWIRKVAVARGTLDRVRTRAGWCRRGLHRMTESNTLRQTDGRRCRACRNRTNKRFYIRHQESCKKSMREYYTKNRLAILLRSKEYRRKQLQQKMIDKHCAATVG